MSADPPIQVYRVGGLNFVEDGHHRVSVAMATRQDVIDAYVTEVLTHQPGDELADPAGFGLPCQGSSR